MLVYNIFFKWIEWCEVKFIIKLLDGGFIFFFGNEEMNIGM